MKSYLFLLIFSLFLIQIESRVLRHSLVEKQQSGTPSSSLTTISRDFARTIFSDLIFRISIVVTQSYTLYENSWLSTKSGSTLSLRFQDDSISLSSDPPFIIDVPGPNFELTHFRYYYKDSSVKAYLKASWELLGITRRILRSLIQDHIKNLIYPLLPPAMKKKGYRLYNDPTPIETLRGLSKLYRIVENDESSSSSSSTDLSSLPVRDPSASFSLRWPTTTKIPLFETYNLQIGQGTSIFITIDTQGSIDDLRLKELEISNPVYKYADKSKTICIKDTRSGLRSALSIVSFKKISYTPPLNFKFDYDISGERLINSIRRLGRTVDSLNGNTPRSSFTEYRLDEARDMINEKLKNDVPEFFKKIVDEIQPLFSFFDLRRFLSM